MSEPEKKIVVLPTTRCIGRECAHCMFDSGRYGQTMSRETISTVVEGVKSVEGEKTVTVTGGGEPLLVPLLALLIQKLCEIPETIVELVTSGSLGPGDPGYRTFMEVCDLKYDNFDVYLSYSYPYSMTSLERIRFSLPELAFMQGEVIIKVTYDPLTKQQSIRNLLKMMEDGGYYLGLFGYLSLWKQLALLEGDKDIEDQIVGLDHYLMEKKIFLRNIKLTKENGELLISCDQKVHLVSGQVDLIGRGESLVGLAYTPEDIRKLSVSCHRFINPRASVTVFPDGVISFCHQRHPHHLLGETREISLARALSQSEAKRRGILAHFLKSSNTDQDACKYCR